MAIHNMENNKTKHSKRNGREEDGGGGRGREEEELIDRFVSRDARENGCVDLMTKLRIGAAIGELQKHSATRGCVKTSTNAMLSVSCHSPSASIASSFSEKVPLRDASAPSTASSHNGGPVRSVRRSRSIDDGLAKQISTSLHGIKSKPRHFLGDQGNMALKGEGENDHAAITNTSSTRVGTKNSSEPDRGSGQSRSLRRSRSIDDAIAKQMSASLHGQHAPKSRRHCLGDQGDVALKGGSANSRSTKKALSDLDRGSGHSRSLRTSSQHNGGKIKDSATDAQTGRGRRNDRRGAGHSAEEHSEDRSERRRTKSLGPREKLRECRHERSNSLEEIIPKKIKGGPSSRNDNEDDQTVQSTKSAGSNRRRELVRSRSAKGSELTARTSLPPCPNDDDDQSSAGPSLRAGARLRPSSHLKISLMRELGILEARHRKIEPSTATQAPTRPRSFDSLIGPNTGAAAANNRAAVRSNLLSKYNSKASEGRRSQEIKNRRRSSSMDKIANGLRMIGSDASLSSSESDIESEEEQQDPAPAARKNQNSAFIINSEGIKIKASSDLKGAEMRRSDIRNSLFNCLEDDDADDNFLNFVKGGASRRNHLVGERTTTK